MAVNEHELSTIFDRIRDIEGKDARQDTDIEVLKQLIKTDVGYIKDALLKLTNGKSEACLEHTAQIEALKLSMKLLEDAMKDKADKMAITPIWAVLSPTAFLIVGAVIKYLFFK